MDSPSRSLETVARLSDNHSQASLPQPPPPPPWPSPYPGLAPAPPAALLEATQRRTDKQKKPKIRYRPPYMDEYEVEDVKKYVPGGYHPVKVGDKIDEYIVVHKLGSGGFATVWLVQSNTDNRYYSLKIICVDVPSTCVVEKQVFEHLGFHNQSSVVQLIRSFEVTGPNGVHPCLVLPVCGPSLLKWSMGRTFTPGAKFRIAQQVCEGIAFLHQWGVAHLDLTCSNVFFALPDIQSMPREAVCRLLGPTETEKLKLRDGSYSANSPKKNFMIIDFGEAVFIDRPCPRSGHGIPIFFYPPEICFGQARSANSDIWELACLLHDIFCKRALFPLIFGGYELLLSYIVDIVGPLPRSWKGHCRADEYGFWDNGELYSLPDGVYWWFEEIPGFQKSDLGMVVGKAASRQGLAVEQHELFTSLLRDILAREPTERLFAPTVLLRLNAAAHLFGGEVAEGVDAPSEPHPDAPAFSEGYDDSDSE